MKKFSKLAAILAVCAFIFGGLLVSCSPHGTGYGLDDVQPSGGGAGGSGGGSGGGGSGGAGGGSGGGEPPAPGPTPGTALDLSTLTADTVIANNTTVTGTLGANVKISIADGATVTLKAVTINGINSGDSYKWAGLTCAGDATIILEGTNTVKGFWKYYPGLFVPKGKTLTIKGSGSLAADSNGRGAGIGGCYADDYTHIPKEEGSCGTIVIEGGTITATGGYAAGIGCGYYSDCDGVTIKGGTVTAISGVCAAGIGSCQGGSCGPISITGGTVTAKSVQGAAGVGTGQGDESKCGAITVANTVTKFTATKADGAIDSVGRGKPVDTGGTCGAVTIGGTMYWDGSQYQNGGDTILTQGTYTYDPKIPTGGIDGLFSVSATKKVYFSKGNLRATYNNSSWTWSFADHQYDALGEACANTFINYNGIVFDNGSSVDLFGWVGDSSGFTGEAAFGISNSTTVSDYGNADGEALKSDWGTNAISNGGNVANYGWRTLTNDEWNYVLTTRADAASKKGAATVSGVKGWILLPDAWTLPAGVNFTAGAVYTTNSYDAGEWAVMESAGAVFLPVTGKRNGLVVDYPFEGYYWSATASSAQRAYEVKFADSSFSADDGTRYRGAAVRLAKDSE